MPEKKEKIRKPIQKRATESKQRLIDAAYRLVKARGYEATGIRDVAEAAGVSIGTFYAYYADKGDIGTEVIRRYGEEFYGGLAGNVIAKLPAKTELPELLLALMHSMAVAARKNLKLHRELATLSLTDARVSAAVTEAENMRIAEETAVLFGHFGAHLQIRRDPTALSLAQRIMDDIVTRSVLCGFEAGNEIIFRETANMVAAYLQAT